MANYNTQQANQYPAFKPVYGLEANIKKAAKTNGYLYFATDSGKIYLDTDKENKKLMGGSGTSLFYANENNVEAKPGEVYILSISTIDDPVNLKKSDLIINQSDGCFYKITSIDEINNKVSCSLIAVSGTGGGGGGSGPSTSDNLEMKVTGIQRRSIFIYNKPALITVTPTAKLDTSVDITYVVISNEGQKSYIAENIQSGSTHTFDIGSMLAEGLNDVKIYVTGENSGEIYLSYIECQAVIAGLNGSVNVAEVLRGQHEIYVTPIGQNLTKTLTLTIDGQFISSKEVVTSNQKVPISLPGQKHGKHEIEISMTALISNKNIPVATLTYELAWVEEGNNTPIIWFEQYDKEIANYSVVPIKYMVYHPEYSQGVEFQIELLKEGLSYNFRNVAYNDEKMHSWNITDYALGMNTYGISCGGTSRNIEFTIVADTSRPNMEILPTGLYLSLDSKGRSNSELSYNRNTWYYKNNLTPSTEFHTIFNNDFNWYNNGWVEPGDEQGISALRIANGASISIPLNNIMKQSGLDRSWTFEFRFKIRNIKSYKSLINTSGAGEEDVSSSIAADFAENIFADFYGGGTGFCFGPSDVFFAGGGALPSVKYKGDQIINVSIVVSKEEKMIYLYVNGIMSKVVSCDTSSGFNIASSSLNFNSQVCDIDLYKVRVYQIALDHTDIVRNYIADLRNINIYDANNITATDDNGNQTIDLTAIKTYNTKNPNNVLMPYAILKVNDNSVQHDLLPYIKGGKVKCDVTFVNAPLDAAYASGELDAAAASVGQTVEDFYQSHAPSFTVTQAEVDVQGTSSQGYPRRNYKLKFNKGSNWQMNEGPFKKTPKAFAKIQLDSALGETVATWKADYMESSGTHNTGFTSYVKTLYDKHPLEDYYTGPIDNYEDLRTTIYGFPMMVFQHHKDGTYEFIGKYNFNYDKACPEVTGMTYDKQHPILTDKKMSEVAECWEFCNNKGTRCSFNQVDFEAETGLVYNEELGEYVYDYTLEVLDDFEVRYNSAEDQIKDWIKAPSANNNKLILEKYKNLEDVCKWLYNLNTNPVPGAPNDFTGTLAEPVIIDNKEYTEDNEQYRLAKFKSEFNEHFDLHYCLIYFIMTELLICYDSRGKNMMFASWGPQKIGGNYIWYPIFYDVDTQLGVNNSGYPLWDYNVAPSDSKIFSTPDSVLWNNFYKAFLSEIRTTYSNLRTTKLNFNNLNGYYDFNPEVSGSYAMKGIRPYVVYNADEYFKYIAPARTGYIDTSGNVATTSSYYYCAQGTRELQRELFLTNRFYYMDSKFRGGSFEYKNIGELVQMRANYNVYLEDKPLNEQPTSDSSVQNDDYPNSYDVPPYISVTPYLTSYPSFYIDSSFTGGSSLTQPGDTADIYVGENLESIFKNTVLNTNKGQLLYICGKEYLSDLGDLSRYYLDELKLQKANKLTSLKVGSDLENYKNQYFTEGVITLDTDIGYPLMEEINFSKLSAYQGILDFSKSEKLKIFRALGSGIAGINFADGVQLTTCYLPKTITTLKLTEANMLDKVLEILPNYNYTNENWPEGLYVQGLTNYLNLDTIKEESNLSNLATDITSINVIGGKLGINSYRILNALTSIKQRAQASSDITIKKDLSVHMTDVKWCPYEQVESGAIRDLSATYFKLTDHYTFDEYTYEGPTQWDIDTLNGKVFVQKFIPDNEYPITNLDLLDTFIINNQGYFHDSTGNQNTYPYLSGSLYVHNSADNEIDEAKIKNYYNKYYPNLNIYVNNVTPALTINYVEIKENGQEFLWETQKFGADINGSSTVTPISVTPTKANWDFQGWSLSKSSNIIDEKQPINYTIDEIKSKIEESGSEDDLVITFYAIYTIHKYVFEFYNSDGSGLVPTVQSDGTTILEPYVLEIPYGDQLYAPADIIPYLDDRGLGLEQTYNFIGYSLEKGNNGTAVDFSKLTSIKDQTFYALFEIMDVHSAEACHPEWFNYIQGTYKRSTYLSNESSDEIAGYYISPKLALKGKITLPSTYAGQPVIGIAGNAFTQELGQIQFKHEITHIFLQKNSKLKVLRANCFRDLKTLEWFDFGADGYDTLEVIEKAAFRGVPLKNRTLGQKLFYVATEAFINAFSNDTNTILYIPSSIKAIGENGFSFLRMAVGSEIIIGSQENPSQLDLSLPAINSNEIVKFKTDQNPSVSGSPYYIQKIEFYSSLYDAGDYIGETQFSVENAFPNIKNIYII